MKKMNARSRRMTWVNLRASELLGNQGQIKPSWGVAFRAAQAEYNGMIEDAIEDSDYALSRSEAIEFISDFIETEIGWMRERAVKRKAAAICKAKVAAKVELERVNESKKFDFVKYPEFGCYSGTPENVMENKYDPAEERRRVSRYKMC